MVWTRTTLSLFVPSDNENNDIGHVVHPADGAPLYRTTYTCQQHPSVLDLHKQTCLNILGIMLPYYREKNNSCFILVLAYFA